MKSQQASDRMGNVSGSDKLAPKISSFFFFCSRVTAAWKKEDEVWSFIFCVGEKKEDLGHGVESGCSQNLNV